MAILIWLGYGFGGAVTSTVFCNPNQSTRFSDTSGVSSGTTRFGAIPGVSSGARRSAMATRAEAMARACNRSSDLPAASLVMP